MAWWSRGKEKLSIFGAKEPGGSGKSGEASRVPPPPSYSGAPRVLDPTILGQISSLELLARAVVEGVISGLHRSPYTGFSTEFAEYRQYLPGDDLRYLDWKLLGRTDRYYIRKYRADTNAQLHIVIDASRSMSYGSGAITKLAYAKFLGATLAYLANRQQDAVGLIAFDEEIRTHVPALNRTGHLRSLFGQLEQLEPGRETRLSAMLHAAAERITRRSIVLVLSDFYGEPEETIEALQHLGYRGNDVIVFHLLDRNEREFNFQDPVLLEDAETGVQMHVIPDALGAGYRQVMEEHIAQLREGAARHRIDYTLVTTDQPLDGALLTFLAQRVRQ
jgi:uncharacterized protein (DUF58 family)